MRKLRSVLGAFIHSGIEPKHEGPGFSERQHRHVVMPIHPQCPLEILDVAAFERFSGRPSICARDHAGHGKREVHSQNNDRPDGQRPQVREKRSPLDAGRGRDQRPDNATESRTLVQVTELSAVARCHITKYTLARTRPTRTFVCVGDPRRTTAVPRGRRQLPNKALAASPGGMSAKGRLRSS
jgi:hypothetical protein